MGWLLSFIPGGQIFGILGAIGSAVGKIIEVIFDSIAAVMLHPITLVCVGIAFGGGTYVGASWHRHKLEVAHAEIGRIHKQWKDSNTRNANDLSDALVARQKAEDLARSVEKSAKDAAVRAGRAAERVRQPQPVASPGPNQPGWSLPSLPSLLKTN